MNVRRSEWSQSQANFVFCFYRIHSPKGFAVVVDVVAVDVAVAFTLR